jgi:hypothetical protein
LDGSGTRVKQLNWILLEYRWTCVRILFTSNVLNSLCTQSLRAPEALTEIRVKNRYLGDMKKDLFIHTVQ